MAKFRKVAETQGIPDYLEQQLMPKDVADQDIYAHLRESAAKHQQVIAKETIGNNRQANNVAKDWERVTSAEEYHQPRMNPTDERLSNLNSYDLDPKAIRRAGSYTDSGENTRPGINGITFGTDEEIMSVMLRGTTMFDDDIEDMSKRLLASQKANASGMRTAEQQARQQIDRHVAWEKEHSQELTSKKYASSRANSLIRTSVENVSDGPFGLPNYSAMDEHEAQINQMKENKRTQRLAIKQIGKTPEEKRDEWESNAETYANTFQTYKSDWLDELEF